jgi:hypothetical protein
MSALRHELQEKDKRMFKHCRNKVRKAEKRNGSNNNNNNLNEKRKPFMSHYDLIAEVNCGDQNLHYLNQKRQSIFNVASNIDDFESFKYNKMRRMSTKFKGMLYGSSSSSRLNDDPSNQAVLLTVSKSKLTSKVAPENESTCTKI